MQILMYWDPNMLYLLNIQLYHLLVILARIFTLDQYIHPRPIRVDLYQKLLTSTTGMAHLLTCQPPTHFLLWIFIITVGNTIPLLSLLQAVA